MKNNPDINVPEALIEQAEDYCDNYGLSLDQVLSDFLVNLAYERIPLKEFSERLKILNHLAEGKMSKDEAMVRLSISDPFHLESLITVYSEGNALLSHEPDAEELERLRKRLHE